MIPIYHMHKIENTQIVHNRDECFCKIFPDFCTFFVFEILFGTQNLKKIAKNNFRKHMQSLWDGEFFCPQVSSKSAASQSAVNKKFPSHREYMYFLRFCSLLVVYS